MGATAYAVAAFVMAATIYLPIAAIHLVRGLQPRRKRRVQHPPRRSSRRERKYK